MPRALSDFERRLPSDSVYFRFFGLDGPDPEAAAAACDVDYRDRYGYVGDGAGRIVAVAHYRRDAADPARAEVDVRRRRASPGPGSRHAPARAPRRNRPRARHRDLRGQGAGAEPAHARRLRELRIPDAAEGNSRRRTGRGRADAHAGLRREDRPPLRAGRRRLDGAPLRAPLGGGDRRQPRARKDRRGDPPQPRRHRLSRPDLPGESARPRRSRASAATPASPTSKARSISP